MPIVDSVEYYQKQTAAIQQKKQPWRTLVTTAPVVLGSEYSTDQMLVLRNGKQLVNFSSNDYLGLSQDEQLKQASIEAIQTFGTGSGSARLISGSQHLTHQLEKELANWKSTEAALVFNTGYQANVGILQAILKPGDWVFCDKLNHASLVDGCRLSGARWCRYNHLDLAHLERRLQKAPVDALKWIVTDSVFSMDGDYPDLKQLVSIAKKHHALIMLDEAHASGLFGEHHNSGLAEHFGVSQDIALQVGTFSKALGGSGAFVAGSSVLIEWLVNHARGFIYSTALPPAVIASALQAVKIVRNEASSVDSKPPGQLTLQQQLWHNIRLFESSVIDRANSGSSTAQALQAQLSFPLKSPIIPVMIGNNRLASKATALLEDHGFFIQAIRPPTVPENTARLRISLSAAHSEMQIKKLVTSILATLEALT